MNVMIGIYDGVARHPDYRLPYHVNLEIMKGEQVAILGPNGCGKSMLVDMMTGRHPLLGEPVTLGGSVRHVSFQDAYGVGDGNYYYQLRWNQHELDDVPTAGELLQGIVNQENAEWWQKLDTLMGLNGLMDKKVVALSSGELRRFQLAKVLLGKPDCLILENPFIGLDSATRKVLADLLRDMADEFGLTTVLVVSRRSDIPEFVTRIIEDSPFSPSAPPCEGGEYIDCLDGVKECPSVVEMHGVTIRYGERVIMDNFSLTVRRGERWALMGPNGSGKSTLLGLIAGDHLQAYSNDIVLFGRQRGSGESIWDIKRRIGYVSPELHRAYRRWTGTAASIVASGLEDSVGLYRRPSPEAVKKVERWMEKFGIAKLKDRPFQKISSGEQRLVLVARAFVKEPDLLILDEPMHGLDDHNMHLVQDIINDYFRDCTKTLLMVTHYKEELPACVDRLCELKVNKEK